MNSDYLIILLNYNNWQDTLECINSLKKSDVQSSNILVIENCSSDNSLGELYSKAPDIKILKMEKNLGFTGGNNIGIKYASDNNYGYAILLNNDTIIEDKGSIQKLINEMEKNEHVTLGTGRIFYYPQKNKIWYDGGKLIKSRGTAVHFNYGKDKREINLNDNLRNIDFISGCFTCIRLRDLSKLGFMDERFFIYLDDIEFSARAVKNNLKLMYFPETVIYHKANGEGKLTPRMVYYTVRNRRLLIDLHFGIITRFYFELALLTKRVLWFFTNKKYYNILVQAISDYKRNYFGQIHDMLNNGKF